MLHPIIAFRAATSRSSELANAYKAPQRARRAERPGAPLEELVKRWVEVGVPRAVAVPLVWLRRLQHRHELARLTREQLADVGLDANAVRRESEKPFWQA
jgi:uncharacterized protein YjiS (DUF1127 family)